MTTDPLLARITDCTNRQHDVDLEMLELAEELLDHAKRRIAMTGRLQKSLKTGLDAPQSSSVMVLPRVLRSGPAKRGDGPEYPSDVEPPHEAEAV